jgi:hypothetical protein
VPDEGAAENATAQIHGVIVAPLYKALIHVTNRNITLVGADGVHPNNARHASRESNSFPSLQSEYPGNRRVTLLSFIRITKVNHENPEQK